MTRFLVVPQWQGSPAPRAMLLVDGAEAIAGDLPRAATTRVEVPAEAGEELETGIRRSSALNRVAEAVGAALVTGDEPALVIGGDCGVALPAIAHAARTHTDLAVVWFDAHGDLHTPTTSPSGAFAGMALRAVVATSALPGGGAVAEDRTVLVGTRELDEPERAFLDTSAVRVVDADAAAEANALVDAVAATGAQAVYIHVDLDVLDPAVLAGVSRPVPFGLTLAQLTAAIGAVRSRFPLAGASLSGFAPASPAAAVDDLGTILRVVGALA